MEERRAASHAFACFPLLSAPKGTSDDDISSTAQCNHFILAYSGSGLRRAGHDKTLPRALCQKAECPATITSTIGWARVAALLGQLKVLVGEHQTP
ncbi:hypothetical protein BD311DRAFT_765769 [Dichomitus squalens]|uniref:Uncharacterized protein n=1 Tax=Dichomitus squalens TaxID=114155 RepID=A0A4Q9MG33_9APHY|nr:hypothetical protein BD311DRAFT_765769 [Dichomitus squalens]